LANGTNVVISLSGIPGSLHDLRWKSDMTNSWSTAISNCAFAAWPMQLTNMITGAVSNRLFRVKATH
jgi:hypothetical protein